MNKEIIKTFYKGKKVLVTGHTGFVGSWLCVALKYFGADIVGLSLEEEKGSIYEQLKEDIKVTNYYVNLCDSHKVINCIEKEKPEIVFHIAAYGFVKECMQNPVRAYESNVIGTINLLQSICESECIKKIVVASSDKVYQNANMNDHAFTEDEKLGGDDPYSCSKTCEDMIVQSYFTTYLQQRNIGVIILRPSNILGGGDHNKTRLIPSIVDSVRKGEVPKIRNPEAVRPWQDILDVIDAYLYSGMLINSGELKIYNVGPDKNQIRTVGEITKTFIDIAWQEKKSERFEAKTNNNDVLEHECLRLNSDKIFVEAGWKPRVKIEDTFAKILNFEEERDKDSLLNIMTNDIFRYYEMS